MFYQAPYNHAMNGKLSNDAKSEVDIGFIAHLHLSEEEAIAASNTAVHAAVDCSEDETIVTSGFIAPPSPRNISVTASATTAADILAVVVKVTGKNAAGEIITETLPAFTAATAATKEGAKAFASVDKVEIPAMGGDSAKISVGFGDICGLGYVLAHNTVLMAHKDNTKESTAPTVVCSESLENNTFDLNSALNGKVVDVYLIV
ncbi:MAG: hypothetical protein A2Y17_12275 [Clostridiales bacterium GWF2_38_85]|nr:MAG: hypothetical protein A2Y17_12275 [Clostridiales bacterium GWF2_38_85]